MVQRKKLQRHRLREVRHKVSLLEIQLLSKFLSMITIFNIFLSSLEHSMHGHFISRHYQNELEIWENADTWISRNNEGKF